MTTKIVFSGFGGQGVLSLGQLVANIAMRKGLEVTWMPSYGAEMRGGTANCSVVISKAPIASPFVASDIDILCAMNLQSLGKFLAKMRRGGLLLYNSSIVTQAPKRCDIRSHAIDATNLATSVGNPKVQNMAMLAGFLSRADIFTIEDVKAIMSELFGKKRPQLVSLNMQVIQKALWLNKQQG